MLPLREIYRLCLNSQLVGLSACHTLGTQVADGDWIDGLARAFFCAGANSVLCTSQKLNDRAAPLMTDLYHLILEDAATVGRSASATFALAVRQAKLFALKHGATAHPANWSAIVYFGLL